MQATATAVTLVGLEPHLVRVEADSGRGLPGFQMVGLPEAAVRESRVRVKAALKQLDVDLGEHVMTVNLAPAYLRKVGSGFDLAVALATLGALERVRTEQLASLVLLGELSLGGQLRPVRGVLPALLGARQRGLTRAIVSAGNAAEAAAVRGVQSLVADNIAEVVAYLDGKAELAPARRAEGGGTRGARCLVDLCEVRGQPAARRALEIAAAGAHPLLMMGPPGAGKTMLARRLPTVLPQLDDEESLEVTAIHSVAGLLGSETGLLRERPFRAPHHTLSAAALLGGGDPVRPGEMSLAHQGVLFLDELLEFRRHVLEGMRQPLESGEVTICRARSRATFPARPLMVAAVNPCPCGYVGDPRHRCSCTPQRIARYRERLSGPLLDRIDLQLVLPPVSLSALQSRALGESSAAVRARVERARGAQRERARRGEVSGGHNAALSQRDLERVAPLDGPSSTLIGKAVSALGLSARGYLKLRRVARSIADIEGSDAVRRGHLVEALACRTLDHASAPPAVARSA